MIRNSAIHIVFINKTFGSCVVNSEELEPLDTLAWECEEVVIEVAVSTPIDVRCLPMMEPWWGLSRCLFVFENCMTELTDTRGD